MKTINITNLINNLQEVKDKADLDYVRIDEGKGHTLLEVIDDIDNKMGDFNNGLIILDKFRDGLHFMKIYTQLEEEQEEIMKSVMLKKYICHIVCSSNAMLYMTIRER